MGANAGECRVATRMSRVNTSSVAVHPPSTALGASSADTRSIVRAQSVNGADSFSIRNPLLPTAYPAVAVFVILCAIAFSWALYTRHAWEDYYIAYRAAKNLATGHGLTFTAGERVQAFSSPLAVLLASAASLLTLNRSDDVALWIFRSMSIAAFAGAGVLLWRCAVEGKWPRSAAILLIALFSSDAKIIDFSTNGMESGILLLFLAWTLHSLFTAHPRRALHLGLAWAGLMWTRPDSIIYIIALGLGRLVFGSFQYQWRSRAELLHLFLRAGAIATGLYLPWLLWAWFYYGTPVPLPITAKALFRVHLSPEALWQWVRYFPASIVNTPDILAATFLPPYTANTGWPVWIEMLAFFIGIIPLCLWLVPGARAEARIASFAFCVGQFYLYNLVRYPVPWYIPSLTLFAVVAIAQTIGQIHSWSAAVLSGPRLGQFASGARLLLLSLMGAMVGGAFAITLLAAYQLRWQQELIESGERRLIGLWLKEHAASPRDTVFLEPVGYIGYFSNLKMFDFAGLTSPEVVAARRRLGQRGPIHAFSAPALILDLQPDWLVLRDIEADSIRQSAPPSLAQHYRLVQRFDVRDKVAAIPFLPGRLYLANDACFEIYQKLPQAGGPAGE